MHALKSRCNPIPISTVPSQSCDPRDCSCAFPLWTTADKGRTRQQERPEVIQGELHPQPAPSSVSTFFPPFLSSSLNSLPFFAPFCRLAKSFTFSGLPFRGSIVSPAAHATAAADASAPCSCRPAPLLGTRLAEYRRKHLSPPRAPFVTMILRDHCL